MTLVTMDTGVYDTEAGWTAHDLAADHWWISADYLVMTRHGRAKWEHAEYTDRGSGKAVLLWRLDVKNGLFVRKRYVDPETPMTLVKE